MKNSWYIPTHNKCNMQQSNSQHQTKLRETRSNPTKIRDKTRPPTLPHLLSIGLKLLARTIKQQKEIKEIQIGKEKVTVSVFVGVRIVYKRDPKTSTIELPLINNFSKVAK